MHRHVSDSMSHMQGLRCFLWGTMPKANSADLWRVEETRERHSGAPWKQLSWHAYTRNTHIYTQTHARTHIHTHKDFGQSAVKGLTPQALLLQTHPLPVLLRRKWEQQWRGRDERHSRVEPQTEVLCSQDTRTCVVHEGCFNSSWAHCGTN